jgi:RNA polymerase sigma-70 factor (ECF subfamily)
MESTDDPLPTRRSLVTRLKHWDDQEAWQRFFDSYWRLIYEVARRSGLADAEAQDVVQDTVIAVAKQMPTFRYDPAVGSFKSWLRLITRRRVADHFRNRGHSIASGTRNGSVACSTRRSSA